MVYLHFVLGLALVFGLALLGNIKSWRSVKVRYVLQLLVVVCTMVAISTALVGPVTFFGLLVANMAYQWMGTRRHAWVLPAVLLWGAILLLGGQVVLERVLGFNSALSVVVEFVGGLVFIYLLMRKGKQ